MEIRFAKEDDIPGLLKLLGQVGEVHHRLRPDLFPAGTIKFDENQLKTILTQPDRPILVAMEGETLLGYCFCVFRSADTLLVEDLCVDACCRGQGVATALFGRLRCYAREKGIRYVILQVWEGNDTARRFYEAMGMTQRAAIMEMKLC